MFTGIITDIGTLRSIEGDAGKRLTIETAYNIATIAIGASVACNGICLTVVERGLKTLSFDASPATLAVTTMKDWQPGQRINLERALKVGDELGGHIVTGHIDGVGVVEDIKEEAGSRHYILSCPPDLATFIAPKGSVTLDGVSLTVTWAEGHRFGLTLIPHTLAVTTWGNKRISDKVNLEVDILARFVHRNLSSSTNLLD